MEDKAGNCTVFMDRDGTLNQDTGYISSHKDLTVFAGVPEAMGKLRLAQVRTILVTNQSGISRGFLTQSDLNSIHQALQATVGLAGGAFDGMYVCPHHPDDGCMCRKPRPGMIYQASQDLGLNLTRSYMVGDKLIDLELAKNAGLLGVLVLTGPMSQDALKAIQNKKVRVEHIAETFAKAVDWILADIPVRRWERNVEDVGL